jgi:hypothetical protein
MGRSGVQGRIKVTPPPYQRLYGEPSSDRSGHPALAAQSGNAVAISITQSWLAQEYVDLGDPDRVLEAADRAPAETTC